MKKKVEFVGRQTGRIIDRFEKGDEKEEEGKKKEKKRAEDDCDKLIGSRRA